jgi:hypothetical protein
MNNENLTVHLKVKDFDAWRTSYNGYEKDRGVCRHHKRESVSQPRRFRMTW